MDKTTNKKDVELNIVYRNIKELKPYKKNAKKHPKEQVERIANSIKEFGFTQPVVIDSNNCVVAGHGRILAARKAGLTQVPTICLDDMTEEQIKAYRLVDNKLNESDWDEVLLAQELAQELEELRESMRMELFGFDFAEKLEDEENKYTMKTNIPQYEVKGECPDITELVDTSKTNELLQRIKESNVPDEVKKFLRLGAYRHLRFDYSKIAEYYAQADKETQELIEDSALVIIDFEDAIAKGYVQLSEQIALLRGEEDEA